MLWWWWLKRGVLVRSEGLLPDVQVAEPELRRGTEPGGVLPHLRRGRPAVERESRAARLTAQGAPG